MAYSKCVVRLLEEQKSWKGEEIVYVNGDVRQLVIRGFGSAKIVRYYGDLAMHPIFFEEDAFVVRSRGSNVVRMKENAIAVYEQYDGDGGSMFSRNGIVSKITGDTVIVDPVRVRFSVQEVAAEIVRRQASRAKGWLPFDLEIVRGRSGSLYGGRVLFRVDVNAGRVIFFEKGNATPAFSYRLSDYFSYLSRAPFVVNGYGFVLEFHGCPKGRLDWILTKCDAADIVNVPIERLPVWSSSFDKPGILVSMRVRSGVTSLVDERVVLRDDPDLFSKAVASLVGGSAPITMKAASGARAMYRDQIMLPSGGVVLPRSSDALVEELLARAVFRRAMFGKAAMIIEESMAKGVVKMAASAKQSMARAVCVLMWTTGRSLVDSFKASAAEFEKAMMDDSWDVAVVEESPKMWFDTCWSEVASVTNGDCLRDPAFWATGIDRQVWNEVSGAILSNAVKECVVRFFSEEKTEKKPPPMGADREDAAKKDCDRNWC
jgi:hypothetical protein